MGLSHTKLRLCNEVAGRGWWQSRSEIEGQRREASAYEPYIPAQFTRAAPPQGLSVKNSRLKGLLCSSPQARMNIESLEKEALYLFTPW